MARYIIMQSRNDGEPVQVGPTTRRYNGAVNVRDDHVLEAAKHLRSKAFADERVVTGPTTRGPDSPLAVILLGRTFTLVITTWIERKRVSSQ